MQRKPTKLKELAGTERADRRKNEPKPKPGPVAMPRGVLTPSARKAWHTWAPELQRLGLLTPIDAPLFMLTTVWAGVATDAARMLREEGLVTEDDRGRERKNRALTMLRAASSELRQLSRAFGLTPADRAGLDVDTEEKLPNLADLLVLNWTGTEGGSHGK